jgi:hypothetical protein
MKLPTPKKTKKKFYNKYIYKISLAIPGSAALRWYDFDRLLTLCMTNLFPDRDTAWREEQLNQVAQHKETWINLVTLINTFEKNTFSKRLEGNTIDFYTNDFNFYNKIGESFTQYIRMRYQPKIGTEKQLLDSDKEIFVEELPYSKYQYRAYLKPHRLDATSRHSVAEWLDKQQPQITFSSSIKTWIKNTNENWGRRYIDIVDEKTLLMLRLRSPQLLGKVFKYTLNR